MAVLYSPFALFVQRATFFSLLVAQRKKLSVRARHTVPLLVTKQLAQKVQVVLINSQSAVLKKIKFESRFFGSR